jgi:shikimate kinase
VRGIARSWGAISFVNALASGVGSAGAVALPVDVLAEVVTAEQAPTRIEFDPPDDAALARATVLEIVRRARSAVPWRIRVSVRSTIPVARGLKSSSAVGTAVAAAVGRALGLRLSSDEVARAAAETALAIGQSATGAFDDAFAACAGGLVVADVRERRVLRHEPAPADWSVLLWIPKGTHRPSSAAKDRFRTHAAAARAASEAAASGDYLRAMELNTAVVERAMGYDYRALHDRFRRAGALASGVSGMGPAVAAILPKGSEDAAARELAGPEVELRTLPFTPPEHGGLLVPEVG